MGLNACLPARRTTRTGRRCFMDTYEMAGLARFGTYLREGMSLSGSMYMRICGELDGVLSPKWGDNRKDANEAYLGAFSDQVNTKKVGGSIFKGIACQADAWARSSGEDGWHVEWIERCRS
jgi:hypothetical protein